MIAVAVSVGTYAALSRQCPQCGGLQTLPIERIRQTVRCHRCGTGIPPGQPRPKLGRPR
jgi:hypothetical protein